MTAADLNTEQIKKIMTDFEMSPDGKTQIPEELLESVHKVIVGMFFWSVLKIFYKALDFDIRVLLSFRSPFSTLRFSLKTKSFTKQKNVLPIRYSS